MRIKLDKTEVNDTIAPSLKRPILWYKNYTKYQNDLSLKEASDLVEQELAEWEQTVKNLEESLDNLKKSKDKRDSARKAADDSWLLEDRSAESNLSRRVVALEGAVDKLSDHEIQLMRWLREINNDNFKPFYWKYLYGKNPALKGSPDID